MRNVRDQPSTTQEELVNGLKAVWTTVTKRTISNTLHREGCARKVPLLKKTHAQASLKFAKEHLDDPEEVWEKVMWSDETKIELFVINSKCWVQPQEHHPHCEAWRWKPYALGVGRLHRYRGEDEWGPCTGKFWGTTSFPQWEHWKLVVDNNPKHTAKATKEWLKKKHTRVLDGLASLQT